MTSTVSVPLTPKHFGVVHNLSVIKEFGGIRSSPAAIRLNPALRPHRLGDQQKRWIKRCIGLYEFQEDKALLAAERQG